MKRIAAAILSVIMVISTVTACSDSKPGDSGKPSESTTTTQTVEKTDNKQIMRDMSIEEIVNDMGIGINLGNTLESCGDWISKSSISNYEKAWGSPIISEDMIKGYADAGFKVVRIPVAWSNLIADDYTINADLMDRVNTIVDYVIDNGMYAIVNIHWDNGWFEKFSTDYDECLKKYKTIWTQICDRFKGYGDYLMFESLNEEGCFNDIWNRYSGVNDTKQKAYDILNNINQEFVDLVRASGGNNGERPLLIAGYATDIDLTCDECYRMPDDPKKKCAVSVHYYTPSTFAILSEDADWGKARKTWGTESDIEELNKYMDMMKENFVDKGIPVIIGEYGCEKKNKELEQVRNYLLKVCEAAYDRGMCPVLWDTSETHYSRYSYKFLDSELGDGLKKIASGKREMVS